MSSLRRDARAMVALSVSAWGSAAFAFAVQALLARSLHATAYGQIVSALAILTLIAPAVAFGMPSFWLKAYGEEGVAAKRWMRASTRFAIGSSLASVVAVGLYALIGANGDTSSRLLLFMLPLVVAPGAIEMASARFQLEDRFGLVAVWQGVSNVARLIVVIACAFLHSGVDIIAAGFGVVGLVIIAGAWQSMASLRHGTVKLAGHTGEATGTRNPVAAEPPAVYELWCNARAFGISNLLYFAYGQSGLVIVAHLMGARDAAMFNVAVTVLTAIYLFPTVLFQKLLMPRFHRWAATNDERLALAFRAASKWMLLCGTGVGIVAAWLAPWAVPLLFGQQYVDAAHVLTLMAICAPFRFLTSSASAVMTTRDRVQIRNLCAVLALASSTTAMFALVPVYGLNGAAVAAIVGEVVWAILAVVSARRCMNHRVPVLDARECAAPLATMEREPALHAPVSVVIPCYNSGRTVERAVASIYRQTWRPAEVILVDDCSTDDTHDYLAALEKSYPGDWLRIVVQSGNAGPGAARNVGWALARHPYLAFLDADDSWHPQKIAIQLAWMDRNPHVCITGHPVEELGESEPLPDCASPPAVSEPACMSRAQVLFSNRFTPSSVIVRAAIGARFDEAKKYAEDYFMVLSLVLVEGGKACLFNTPLSYVYKARFGAKTGLSAQLWKIQKGEQDNYRYFHRLGAITGAEWIGFSALSAAKYLRRCVLSGRFT